MLKFKLAFNSDLYPDYSSSNGIVIVDIFGQRYIDLFGNFSSLPFGHNFDPIAKYIDSLDLPISERVPLCAFNQNLVNSFALQFSEFLPQTFSYLSFAENGGLAIEQVIKSYLFLCSKLDRRCKFYVFDGSYHGIIGLSSSLTKAASTALDRLSFIDSSNIDVQVITSLDSLVSTFDDTAINILFVEPIRCTYGDVLITDAMKDCIGFFKSRSDCYLVYDEIQAGFYATLSVWSYKYLSLPDPDVIVFGKRLQICGFASNTSLSIVFSDSTPKILSSTFDGSLNDIAKSLFMLNYTPKYLKQKSMQLMANINSTVSLIARSLLASDYSIHGCLASLKFDSHQHMKQGSSCLTSNSILHNPTLPDIIRLRFPFNFSEEDARLVKLYLNDN